MPLEPATTRNRGSGSRTVWTGRSEARSRWEDTEIALESRTFVPNQAAFILWPLVTGTLGLGALALLLLVIAPFWGIHLLVAGFFVVPGFFLLIGSSVASRIVQARKTSYTFHDDRVVFRTGGILSNRTIELQLRNVTQAELRIPFIENRIFGTGVVSVTSAGTEHSRIVLAHLDEPEEVHEHLLDRMRGSGFSLARRERLIDTRPSFAALAFREGGVMLLAFVFVVAIVGVALGLGGAEVMERLGLETVEELLAFMARGRTPAGESAFQLRFAFAGAVTAAGALSLLVLVGAAKQAAVHFTRRYTLHDDVVEYETTLFGLNRVVIPVENLADVTTKQGLFGRLLRIADVELSCQGATQAISFHALPDARRFRETLRGILDPDGRGQPDGVPAEGAPEHGDAPGPVVVEVTAMGAPATATGIAATGPSRSSHPASRPTPEHSRPRLEYRPFFRRDAAGGIWRQCRRFALPLVLLVTAPLTLPIVPVEGFDATRWLAHLPLALAVVVGLFVITLVGSITGALLRTRARRYELGGGKLSATHTRVSRTEVEFTFSQITSVVVTRRILDRLMGTATIHFFSIGAQHPVVFEHLRRGREASAEILDRLGMPDGEPGDVIRPDLGPGVYLRARASGLTTSVVLIGASMAGAVLTPLALLAIPLVLVVAGSRVLADVVEMRHAALELHAGHLVGARGVLNKRRHAAPLRQIKDLRSLTYPVSPHGALTFFAGGGSSFTLSFVREAHAALDRLDALLHAHPQHEATSVVPFDVTAVLTASPDVRAPLARTALLSLLVVPAGAPILIFVGILAAPLLTVAIPLLVLAPFILVAGHYMRLKRTRYELQESRVLHSSGILRRGRFSVLLDRIDHLATAQGPLHRMFDTGNISIYTTGSPHVELVLRDLRGYAGWVDRIEPRLPSSRSRRAGAPGSPSGDAPPASDESPVMAKAEGQETPMSDGMGG